MEKSKDLEGWDAAVGRTGIKAKMALENTLPDIVTDTVMGSYKGGGRAYNIQSVLFDRLRWTPVQAKQYLINGGMRHNKIDITDSYLRWRQYNPKKGSRFYTKDIGSGIKYIIEYLPQK